MSLDNRLREFHSEDETLNLADSLATVKRKAGRTIVLRRVGMTAIAAAVVAAAITVPVAILDRDTEPITPVPQPSPTVSFHAATATDQARLIAYVAQNDLWVYHVAADRVTRLTADGDQNREDELAFYGDGYILYRWSSATGKQTGIQAMPVGGGSPITIVEEDGFIIDFDVSRDGTTILYIHTDFDRDNTHRLKQVPATGGVPTVLRELGSILGRGAGSEDEVSVHWSPDGRSILVTDTHPDDGRDAIHWLDAEGKNLVAPWDGTHARWAPDGKTIYYRGYADLGDSRWRAMDVASKSMRFVGFREGSNNLAISPDGRYVAYDTSVFGDLTQRTVRPEGAPAVYLYDVQRGTERRLRSGSVFPIWISPDALIVTGARVPTEPSLNSWEPTGTATKLNVDGTAESVSITSTAWTPATLFDE